MSDLTLNDPDQLPDHLRTILAQHAGPGLSIISADEKRRAAEKLHAILEAAVALGECRIASLEGPAVCVLCGGMNPMFNHNLSDHQDDCPHRRLKEALADD